MTPAEPTKPVALLARAGAARERLRTALEAAGGRIVLEDDPAAIDDQALAAAGAEAVLVALEPAVEEALARLDPALQAPGLRLILDEAEVAAQREGWAAQRWTRHLAAKLHGHDDVLPPGREADMVQPQPGRPPTPAQLQAGAGLGLHLEEAEARAAELPRDGLAASVPGLAGILPDEPEAWTPREPPAGVPDSFDWEPVDLPVPAPLPSGTRQASTASVVVAENAADGTAAATAAPASLRLELEALEPVAGPGGGGHTGGAVLVVAGIGGPDAIRKLLGALEPGFDRPLLLRLRLDGGRHDNLVKQLGRVSALPLELAEAGRALRPGTAYVLPDAIGVAAAHGALVFAEGAAGQDITAVLPPEGSALLMLSGGDPALVPAALALAARGGFAAAQSAEGCYDPAGPETLAAHGVERDTPAGLAQRLLQRRPHRA